MYQPTHRDRDYSAGHVRLFETLSIFLCTFFFQVYSYQIDLFLLMSGKRAQISAADFNVETRRGKRKKKQKYVIT